MADGTSSETITLNPSGGIDIGPSAQVNLFQVRDITVPAPSTLAFLTLGAGAVLFLLRRKSLAI